MQTQLEVENLLINEALQYVEVSDENELIRIVLEEFIKNHRKKNLSDLKGKIKFRKNYNYKEMRVNNNFEIIEIYSEQ